MAALNEVAEIANHIRAELQGFHSRHCVFGEMTVGRLTRAAELLQQQEAEINRLMAQQAPVPVRGGEVNQSLLLLLRFLFVGLLMTSYLTNTELEEARR